MSADTSTKFAAPGTQISAGGLGTRALLEQNYSVGGPYQWAVELWRNVEQVLKRTAHPRGDEELVFDFVELEWTNRHGQVKKPWKRRVWNTAIPMDADSELLPYFSTIAKGAGERFSIENPAGAFGKGSRASILPRSDLLVITTQPGGDSKALYIGIDDQEAYALIQFSEPVEIDGEQATELHLLATLGSNMYLEAAGGWMLPMDTIFSGAASEAARVRNAHGLHQLIHPEVAKKGGVTFIMMGRVVLDDYINGDVAKGESDLPLNKNLADRIVPNLPVRVAYTATHKNQAESERSTKFTRDGIDYYIDRRKLYSLRDWINRVPPGKEHRGSFQLDDAGTTLEWYLLPENWNLDKKGNKVGNKDDWYPFRGAGFVAVAYGDELHPLFPVKNRREVMRNFGLTGAVADRVGILIRPPVYKGNGDWGVQQNESRSTLTGPHGAPLPTQEWLDTYFDNVPKPISEASAQAQPQDVDKAIDPEDVRRIGEILKSRRLEGRVQVVLTNSDGQIVGYTTEDTVHIGGGGGGNSVITAPATPGTAATRLNPKPDGPDKGVPRKTSFMPTAHFLAPDQWTEEHLPEDSFCTVVPAPDGVKIWLNEGHEIYRSQVNYYESTWWNEREDRKRLRRKITGFTSRVRRVVKTAYETEAIAKVLWIHMDARKGKALDRKAFDERCQNLTDALAGYFNVDHSIKTKLGGLAR